MKVFKMNEIDWVCAENEQQAKKFYKFETGADDLELTEFYEGEVKMTDTMLICVDDLPLEEQKMTLRMEKRGGLLWVRKTFAEVIEDKKIKKPCIIASTEY